MAKMPCPAKMRCSCGFTELDDEEIIDHLLLVFEPADGRGSDGQVHEELDLRACSCGFTAEVSMQLDAHFLKQFIPASAIAPDGRQHQVTDA